ncbi:cyclin-like protein [Cryomyces antarcticus]|uniref:Cyclin C-terminal domain-containing protein n=1 Tax=Cryomyces antarcticus TaxID=329879 RepID=A0ABR0KUM1_9PEZI|nr:hypothetical protein LTR39_000366 [Cryomyces antarcticus]KAK5021046.1 hypothetical protein LTR60_000143 [Cryomyces antarcticus]KAK5131772.1 hypothetical protein LTR16_000441 [Cryomyces antarcticus]
MTEDELYRASTQYRLWSFTPRALASLRAGTHALAAEKVAAARTSKRDDVSRPSREGNGVDSNGAEGGRDASGRVAKAADDGEVECLTLAEAQQLVDFYCSKAIELCNYLKWPATVKATALQYLRRFYLSASPLTYPPSTIIKPTIFLANKTENHNLSLDEYAVKAKATRDQILAPEFIVSQGLRFTFDVRHPLRGLPGAYMELMSLADGTAEVLAGVGKTAKELQQELMALPDGTGPANGAPAAEKAADVLSLKRRIHTAYIAANKTLETTALLTDVYFLYTPSQIMFAALLLADTPLTTFYLTTKIPPASPLPSKIRAAVESCARILRAAPVIVSQAEASRLKAKLERCRDQDKLDLVGLNRALKRDGREEGVVTESVAKRRKLEREMSAREGEELFGPEIGRQA